MNKRIIMLAKIALIIAAAQIHITAANFISTQTNTPSNATYAMNNECKHPTLEEFKQQIEGSLSEPTTNHLNETDQGTIKKTIQKFIKDDEKDDELIALVLYIANQWELIKELGWQSDAVYKYVQSCLSGLYNSTKDGPTIQDDNPYHKGIAVAIENLQKLTKNNNKKRALLRALLYPGLNQSNQQTVIDKAEVQELTNEHKELTTDEEELIRIIKQCAHIFQKELIGKTNEQMQQKAGSILQHISQLFLPLQDSNQQWLQDNKATIHKLIAGPDNDLQTLIDKAIQNKENAEICNKMAQVRPDLFLTLFLLYDHQKALGQQPQQEDTDMIELAKKIQQNIKQAFLSRDENGANQTKATHSNNPQTQEEQLLNEFLKFIMGWDIPQQTSNNNRSTIFKDAAENIQKASQETTSIELTQQQKNLLRLIKIAYSTLTISLRSDMQKGNTDELTYQSIYIEKYEQILDKVLAGDKIEANQIAKELETKFTELQQEEAKLKEKEERKIYVNVFKPIAYSLLLHGKNHLKSSKSPVFDNIDDYLYNIQINNPNNPIYNNEKTIESCLEELFIAAYKGIDNNDENKTFIKTVILPHQKQQCNNNPSEPQNDKTAFKLKRLLIFIRLIVQVETGQYEEEFSDKEEPTQTTSTSKNLQAMEQDDSLLNEYHITHQAKIGGKPKQQHIKFTNTSLLGLNLLSYRFNITQTDLLEHIRNHAKKCPNDCVNKATNKLAIIQQILNDKTNIETNDQKTNEQPEAQLIINQTEQLSKQIKKYINELPKGTNEVWADTTNRYITHLQWLLQRITKEELSYLIQKDKEWIIKVNNECINRLQEKIKNQKREQEEREKREKEQKAKKEEEERLKTEEEERLRKEEEKAKKEAEQKAKKEEQERLKQEEERERKEKAQGSKLSTTQKIINNLSATNKMIQIITQILY